MFWLWVIIAMVLARPLVAGVIVLVIWLALDRAWVSRSGIARWWQRRRLEPKLRTALEVNPHDRNARFQLAELLVGRNRFDEALALIEKNLKAGDADDETLFVAGVAAYGSTADTTDQAEDYLARARDESPSFRSGAIEMALGEGRLRHAEYARAAEALRAAIAAQPGSIKAHVLLARALEGAGQSEAAAEAKAAAWSRYTESPRFQRRRNRTWAWRANPLAAVRFFGAIAAALAAFVVAASWLSARLPSYAPGFGEYDGTLTMQTDGYNVDGRAAPEVSRFEIAAGDPFVPGEDFLSRADLNENGTIDLERKLHAGDLWCRLVHHFPQVAETGASPLEVTDRDNGHTFGVHVLERGYASSAAARPSALAFEALLESAPPPDCSVTVVGPGFTTTFGLQAGVPFQREP